MYKYDEYDRALVKERVAEFRDQVERRLNGELSEEEFIPLRLQNGVYLQKHAYMLRVAIPYGALSSSQLRMLAFIAEHYDNGYGHFTTRQNIQYNWIKLEQVPDILEHLSSVDMHAIQTSGNCVRNVTTEAFAGVAADEVYDPRVFAELLRQWSTINPEFLFLPRKFKIAVCAASEDRAAVRMHDIGLYLYRDSDDQIRFRVMVGGGLGRTPFLNKLLRDDLHWKDLLSYVEAILRVYNRYGRRDNKYKARIKILVNSLGLETFREDVDAEWEHLRSGHVTLTDDELARVAATFIPPLYKQLDEVDLSLGEYMSVDEAFLNWVGRNVKPHKIPGYSSVVVSTKQPDKAPGDMTAEQMREVAEIADRYGFGEIRVAHEQNLVLPDIAKKDLYSVWKGLCEKEIGAANNGLLSDMIVCPGADYCSLATAHSIPVANKITALFSPEEQHLIGDISLNVSGCINSCAHHHLANIGVLGLNKGGKDYYQITLGGQQGEFSSIGKVLGPSLSAETLPTAIKSLASVYLNNRASNETFYQCLERIGLEPYKEAVYQVEEAAL